MKARNFRRTSKCASRVGTPSTRSISSRSSSSDGTRRSNVSLRVSRRWTARSTSRARSRLVEADDRAERGELRVARGLVEGHPKRGQIAGFDGLLRKKVASSVLAIGVVLGRGISRVIGTLQVSAALRLSQWKEDHCNRNISEMSRRALSATRAADLLNYLAAHPDEPLTYSELSNRLGINQASTHNLLMALTECGYLVREPRTRTFSLGAALVAIGDAALRGNPVIDEARVQMAKLAKALDMGAVALVRAGGDALCISRAGPRRAQVDPPEVGQRVPIMAPLVSVFVAWASDDDVERWLQRGSASEADRARAREILERVRNRGYSVALEVPGRRRVGGLIAELAEHPHSDELRRQLHATIGELGRGSYPASRGGRRHAEHQHDHGPGLRPPRRSRRRPLAPGVRARARPGRGRRDRRAPARRDARPLSQLTAWPAPSLRPLDRTARGRPPSTG